MKPYLAVFLLLTSLGLSAQQEKKTLTATRIDSPPKIDGVLDDAVWESLPAFGSFNPYEPGNEGNIDPLYQSEVKMAYDDKAIYVAAYLKDPNPESIFRQFSQRDEIFVQADHFSIALNTYNDGINETHFFITSAGTIGDARASQGDFDFGYNVVFEGRTSIYGQGWYAEFKIPYRALRFPEVAVQDWGVNFYRRIVSINQSHTWNWIDVSTGNESQYSGNIVGIENIDPPVRLTFFPFAQALVSNFDGETQTDFSAGMDLKYGLSDSFTLDATLIPDFGQVAFDELRLNLGPFEQTFDENRPFFTEGVELFDKGGIFFSRRIGGPPSGQVDDLSDTEEITEFPDKVNLLNALKISGRTNGNLGVGVLNAVTERTFAEVRDTASGSSRKTVVEGLANYNVLVLDQQFNGNSSVSLVNTNVIREDGFRDANTTAAVFDLADKGNNFRFSGRGIMSNVNQDGWQTGYRTELDFFRIKGKFRYRFGHDFADTKYDINDLGLNFRNNFNNFVAGASYQIFQPTTVFNRYRINLTVRHRRLYKPDVQTGNEVNLNWFFATKERFAFGGFVGYNSENRDYFEPRVDGRYLLFDPSLGGRLWVSTDFRKRFAFDAGIGHRSWFNDPQAAYFVDFAPRYRFSDKFLVVLRTDLSLREDNFGYIDDNGTDVFLGQRDLTTIENSITASFNFDPYKAIDLRFRNFWSTADYTDDVFYVLEEDGTRTEFDYDTSQNDPNTNFNIWNLDLSFRWRFAPGSEATLLYRNQIFLVDELSTLGYGQSLQNLFEEPAQNSVSLRVTYFIDYIDVKGLFQKKDAAL